MVFNEILPFHSYLRVTELNFGFSAIVLEKVNVLDVFEVVVYWMIDHTLYFFSKLLITRDLSEQFAPLNPIHIQAHSVEHELFHDASGVRVGDILLIESWNGLERVDVVKQVVILALKHWPLLG